MSGWTDGMLATPFGTVAVHMFYPRFGEERWKWEFRGHSGEAATEDDAKRDAEQWLRQQAITLLEMLGSSHG